MLLQDRRDCSKLLTAGTCGGALGTKSGKTVSEQPLRITHLTQADSVTGANGLRTLSDTTPPGHSAAGRGALLAPAAMPYTSRANHGIAGSSFHRSTCAAARVMHGRSYASNAAA